MAQFSSGMCNKFYTMDINVQERAITKEKLKAGLIGRNESSYRTDGFQAQFMLCFTKLEEQ